MKHLLTDWGFTREGWRTGQHGEYWVVAQTLLLLGLLVLPVYRLPGISPTPLAWAIAQGGAIALGGLAAILLGKGVLDLGKSLTPLPYPKADGQLTQTGIYGLVRHPIYSGVVLLVVSLALFQLSVTHGLAAIAVLLFFNAKASREERWLTEKYADYPTYQTRVKKLIPWIY